MKKRNLLKALVALAVLSSMLLSTLLGVSTALITKTLSKKLNFESIPDLDMEYYLYDADTTASTSYEDERGVYKNAHSFKQEIIVGKIGEGDDDFKTKSWESLKNDPKGDQKDNIFFGRDVVYQIKIPVDESGYYTLHFTPQFIKGDEKDGVVTYAMKNRGDSAVAEQEFYTVSMQYAVGCEILNSEDSATLDFPPEGETPPIFTLKNSVFAKNTYYEQYNYLAESAFQWKTLSPTRAENVNLTYKVTEADAQRGYVIWAWELTGLKTGYYQFICDSLYFEKTMELNGSTSYRTSTSEPYFMLPQTLVTNNQVKIFGKEDPLSGADGINKSQRRGSNHGGKSEYSEGRGTFVTEATTNSLGLRAETLNSGGNINADGVVDGSWKQDNPLSFQIPIKNVKANTTYKVTFDFSVARQGIHAPDRNITSYKISGDTTSLTKYFGEVTSSEKDSYTSKVGNNWWDYADFTQIFTQDATNELTGKTFMSYLSSLTDNPNNNGGSVMVGDDLIDDNKNYEIAEYLEKQFNVSRLSLDNHKSNLDLIQYNHKAFQGEPLTKYNQVTTLAAYANNTSKHNFLDMTTSKSLNDTYSIDYFNPGTGNNSGGKITSTTMRNWFNAVQRTELNGQVAINWITFYNTTFSFNIPDGQDIDLDNFYWVWAIDALYYENFYNIRIDNLRIEEVVQYSSTINNPNGLKIGDTIVGLAQMTKWGLGTEGIDAGIFNNFRGWNGTGQNFQARGYNTTDYFACGNIYAPIVDAKNVAATPGGGTGETDYKIYLDGSAVCKGGIDKYVWSADGGITWYDMAFSGGNATENIIIEGEKGVDQRTLAQSKSEREPWNTDGHPHTTKEECEAAGCTLQYSTTPYVDFVTFTSEADGLHSNFNAVKTMVDGVDANGNSTKVEDIDQRVWRLEADISVYKGQSDLDIIIAAAPASNPSLRCEIIRIINYNSANTYVSKVMSVKSDIKSDAIAGNNKNLSLAETDLSITSGAGAFLDIFSDEGKDKYYENYAPVYENGIIYNYNAKTATENAETQKIDYERLQATYSGLPVKKDLIVVGGVVCAEGVYEYCYSVDGGKTWSEINSRTNSGDATDEVYKSALSKWITKDESGTTIRKYITNCNGNYYDGGGCRLYVDLSAYAGQVLDVIVAVKPNFQGDSTKSLKTDIYLPIAKVDNVAVYGENGTFYTSINNVILDRVNDSNRSPYVQTLTPTMTHLNGDYFTGKSKSEWSSVVPTTDWAYTMLEPQNVDVRNTRFYNNTVNEMMSGGKVTIDGYIVCKGGVNRYKYSLDGGETWTIIEDIGTAVPEDSGDVKLFGNALYADAGFTLATDGKNGNFSSSAVPSEANPTSHLLEFDLPALADDEDDNVVKNLLVVAESNDKDNKPSGQLFPVLHIRLKFKYASTEGVKNTTQYGYYRSVNNGTSKAAGYIQNTEVWTFTPTGETNDAFNRLTIPVSEAGTYKLTANVKLTMDGDIANKTISCTLSSDSTSGNTRFFDVNGGVIAKADALVSWSKKMAKTNYSLSMTVTVSEEDAKRGYIIWDWNLRSLPVDKMYVFTLSSIKLAKAT